MLLLAVYVTPSSWGREDKTVAKPILDGCPKSGKGAGAGTAGVEVEDKVTKRLTYRVHEFVCTTLIFCEHLL
jgi:hypothetical protein